MGGGKSNIFYTFADGFMQKTINGDGASLFIP